MSLLLEIYMMLTRNDFLETIEVAPWQWKAALQDLSYDMFKIPKKKGGWRTIEAPCEPLKSIQGKIGHFLQYQYLKRIPPCVHGYIPSILGIHRSIITNAQAHLGKPYLLNIDLKDFFHLITKDSVKQHLMQYGAFDRLLMQDILSIVTKDNRLPMGAPSSPVLSNICSHDLDRLLQEYAVSNAMQYSRFVDDLSFSSDKEFDYHNHLHNIKGIIKSVGFKPNKKKIKYYQYKDIKIVTGIEIHGMNLRISSEFYEKAKKNIRQWKKLNISFKRLDDIGVHYQMSNLSTYNKIEQSIQGQMQFIKSIEGPYSLKYQELDKLMHKKLKSNLDFDFHFYF